MISEFLAASFFSVFAISVLLCYRAGKILNLSLSSISTLGAYLHFNPFLATLLGIFAGFLLHESTKKLEIARATIFSLGLAIAIEEIIRIIFKKEYIITHVQILELFGENVIWNHLIAGIISISFLFLFFSFLFSKKSKTLKIVEEDHELAEIYGIKTERARKIILSFTGGLIALISSFYNQGIIYPTIGWQNLIFATVIATVANVFKEKSYLFAIIFAVVIICLQKFFL